MIQLAWSWSWLLALCACTCLYLRVATRAPHVIINPQLGLGRCAPIVRVPHYIYRVVRVWVLLRKLYTGMVPYMCNT